MRRPASSQQQLQQLYYTRPYAAAGLVPKAGFSLPGFLIASFISPVMPGLSGLSDQGHGRNVMGDNRPNPFCECATVVSHHKLHMACVISFDTPPLRGS